MNILGCKFQSPLGNVTAAVRDNALIGLWFDGQKYFPESAETWESAPGNSVFVELRKWLDAYFRGEMPEINFARAPGGSEFRRSVLRILLGIPYGATTTYGLIAKQIAEERGTAKFSAQAVGGAVGHNPISIIIPCHRVIGVNGSLTGYAGGISKKQTLLELERGNAL
jgi:methylated-DNA-[protein]-cysteine S-methyltransferase